MSTQYTHCQSLLLNVARPYLWVLSFFVAAPPPCLTFDRETNKNNAAFYTLYALYALLLLFMTIWISYMNNLVAFNFVENFDSGSLTNVLTSAQSMTVFFVQALNQLIVLVRFKQLLRIFTELELLEHDIRWHSLSQRMGVSKCAYSAERNFRWQLFRKSGCMLIFTGVFHTATNIFLAAPRMPFLYRILTSFSLILIQMKNVEFCVTVQMVHELLQQLLDELLFVRKQLIMTQNLSDRRFLYAALQHNQQYLSRVWSLVDVIGSYYSLPMLAIFLYDGLAITATVNWAYLVEAIGDHAYQSPRRMVFTANLLINMMVPCWLCQCCIQLYDRFAGVLHDLGSNGSDVRLSMCLREYSLQIMHQKLLFSCDGFFDINLKHFGARILTIMTYVVILIQFRLQGEAEKEHEAKLARIFSYRNETL